MTERFDYTAYDDGTSSIYDRIDDEYYFDMDLSKLEELLNDLNDENEELKKEVKQLKNKIKTYNSTHELLKETIDRLRNNG